MKSIFMIAVTLWLTMGQTWVHAQNSVDETKSATADGYVRVKVVRGDLVIEGWDRDEVSVEGSLDEAMEEFIFDVKGKETVIAVRLPDRLNSWCCDRETDLKIRVPKNSNLMVSLVSAEAEVTNIHGGLELGGVSGELRVEDVSDRIRINNISGEVTLRRATGRVRIKTVSGDIDASKIKGPGVFTSVSGSILVTEIEDEVDLESVSGDVEVTRSKVRSMRAHTVSGDVELDADMLPGANIESDTMSGSVRLLLGGEVDARFDIVTGSGRIRNRITDHKPRDSKYVRDETLRFTLGEGKGEVIASSRSGDVLIEKK